MKNSGRLLTAFIFVVMLLSGCRGKGTDTGDAVLARMDSLQKVADARTEEYADLTAFVNTIALSLDSISSQEDMLIAVVNPEKGQSTREQIRQRIEGFSQLLERQQKRIAQLSDSLKAKGKGANMAQIEKLNGIVAYLTSQLNAKEAELKNIRSQLQNSRASISQLRASVVSLKDNVATLEKQNETLDQVLTTQDEVINECYVKIGTGKELEQAGILTKGGLFKKRKVNYSGFAAAGFQRVDIRHLTEIPFSGKKAKILTGAPAGSYTLSSSGKNKWVLHITNPSSFWSVSNYLVIQTD